MVQFVVLIVCLAVLYFLNLRRSSNQTSQSSGLNDSALTAEGRLKLERLKNAVNEFSVAGLRGLVDTNTPVEPQGTRLGGPLLWPKGQAVPQDGEGKRLILLAQINLSTLPQRLGLPDEGLLQFLIGTDDLMGADGFPTTNGKGCVIVLHPMTTIFEQHEDRTTEEAEYSPFQNRSVERSGIAIQWESVDWPPSPVDYRIEKIMNDGRKLSPADEDMTYLFLDEILQERGSFDILLGGNPDFTQYDIRSEDQRAEHINLAAFSSTGGAFMWGDSGEACFLIEPSALANGDLREVLYSWDCS